MGRTEPPNHPSKLPLTVVCLVLVIGLAVFSAARSTLVFAGIFVVCATVFVLQIRVIRAGRNPWWNRSLLDRRVRRR